MDTDSVVPLPAASLLMSCILLVCSCTDDAVHKEPVTASAISLENVTVTTALVGGQVESYGSDLLLASGVCWSESPNPTLSNFYTSEGKVSGSFTSELTRLRPNTTYYARAYVTRTDSTVYGDEIFFTTHYIHSSIDIYSDKNDYTLCEPITLSIHNTSFKDTIFYTACNGIPMASVYIWSGGIWDMYNGDICFGGESLAILPQQIITDLFDEHTNNGCRPEAGTYSTSYSFRVLLTHEDIFSNEVMVTE